MFMSSRSARRSYAVLRQDAAANTKIIDVHCDFTANMWSECLRFIHTPLANFAARPLPSQTSTEQLHWLSLKT